MCFLVYVTYGIANSIGSRENRSGIRLVPGKGGALKSINDREENNAEEMDVATLNRIQYVR